MAAEIKAYVLTKAVQSAVRDVEDTSEVRRVVEASSNYTVLEHRWGTDKELRLIFISKKKKR